jgi:hypothetical protein
MNPLDDLLKSGDGMPDDGGTELLTELVAAVTWLRRGAMPGLTIWDAIELALRLNVEADPGWAGPDPLATALREFLASGPPPIAYRLSASIRAWTTVIGTIFNEGLPWFSHKI